MTSFGLFDSPRVGMRPHTRKGAKHDIHIKYPNPTSLSFLENWLLNMVSYPGLAGRLSHPFAIGIFNFHLCI